MIKKQVRVSDINKYPYFEWASNKDYSEGNIITYDNKIYKCDESHLSDDNFELEHWVEIVDYPEWMQEEGYLEGDIIIYDNKLYKCKNDHLSSDGFDLDKWEKTYYYPKWKQGELYLNNDGSVVIYNNKLYECIESHLSGEKFDLDAIKWVEKDVYPEWATEKDYSKGETVIYANKIYECIELHSSGEDFVLTNWNEINIYFKWKPDEDYLEGDKDGGDVIIHKNKIYKCTITHLSGDDFEIDKWVEMVVSFDILLTTNINDIGIKEPYVYPEWMPGKEYLEGENGDIVIYDNKVYKCDESHLSDDNFELENWVKIVVYPKWKQEENYSEGDIITHGNKIYKCKDDHLSGDNFELEKWEEIGVMGIATNTVEYIGESRIDEFKRYGKTINDSDLYNTKNSISEGGIIKEIIETKPKIDPFSKQDVYKYTFTDSNNNLTTYDDTGDGSSIISYTANGLNEDNAINLPSFKNEELLGVIGKPKVEVDVFIDRGVNNAFDKRIKISEIKTLEALEKYGNGFFKIKE